MGGEGIEVETGVVEFGGEGVVVCEEVLRCERVSAGSEAGRHTFMVSRVSPYVLCMFNRYFCCS